MTNRNIDPTILLPNLAIFAAIVAGAIIAREPLSSVRPIAAHTTTNMFTESSVKARLWEDPFVAKTRTEEDHYSTDTTDRSISVYESATREKYKGIENLKNILLEKITAQNPNIKEYENAIEITIAAVDVENTPEKQDSKLLSRIVELFNGNSAHKQLTTQEKDAIGEAVAEYHKNFKKIVKSFQSMVNEAPSTNIFTPNNSLAIVVIAPSGFEPEAIESRIRTRQAIFSGMAASQYTPIHAKLLKTISLSDNKANTKKHLKIVYEDFIPNRLASAGNYFYFDNLKIITDAQQTTNYRRKLNELEKEYGLIRVFYLDFESLKEFKEGSLPDGWSHALKKIQNGFSNQAALEIDVIGPSSSDELVKLLSIPSPSIKTDSEIDVFSTWASIEPDILLQKLRRLISNPSSSTIGKPQAKESHTSRKPQLLIDHDLALPLPSARIEPDDLLKNSTAEHTNNPITSLVTKHGTLSLIHSNRDKSLPSQTHIESLTFSDDILSELIIEELNYRRVKFNKSDKHIILISESDTLYGTAFPISFHEKILEQAKRTTDVFGVSTCARIKENTKSRNNPPEILQVHNIHYLKGLDGKTVLNKSKPGKQTQVSEGNEKDPLRSYRPTSISSLDVPDWRPEGRQQYDRIRALAQNLKAFSNRLSVKGEQIAAIGVVGSDVYDKLVILQALRPQFPQTHFFTTDLDANMLSADMLPITQNLIVASTYGLTLNPKIQVPTTPFRDTYQTGVFNAILRSTAFYPKYCKLGLSHDNKTKIRESTNFNLFTYQWQPNLFEIGKHHAFPLRTVTEPKKIIDAEAVNLIKPDPINLKEFVSGFIIMALALIATFIAISQRDLPENVFQNSDSRLLLMSTLIASTCLCLFSGIDRMEPNILLFSVATTWIALTGIFLIFSTQNSIASVILFSSSIAAILVSFASLAKIIYISHHYAKFEEPFALMSGISTWPSEILRLIGLTLALCYCYAARKDITKAFDRLPGKLNYQHVEEDITNLLYSAELGEKIKEAENKSSSQAKDKTQVLPVLKSGEAFLIGLPYNPWAIVFAAGCLFGIAGLAFFIYGPPPVPARGAAAVIVDKVILFSTLALVYLLTTMAIFVNLFAYQHIIKPCMENYKLSRDSISGEIALKLIERFSIDIQRLPIFPCLIIFVLLLSRHSMFDNWTLPIPVIISVSFIFGLLLVVNVFTAFHAKRFKAKIQSTLETDDLATKSSSPRQAVDSIRAGFFGSPTQNPVFRALLIPLSGGGLISLTDYLLRTL